MTEKRLYLLDFLRGLLLLIMVIYHYTFNLSYFFNYPIDLDAFFLKIIPPVFSSCFLLVSGYSSTLSRNSFKRGTYILYWAMVVTIVTFIFIPEAPVYFGILHCIGLMMILSRYLKKLPDIFLIIMSVSFFILGYITKNYYLNHNLFLFLGITSSSFASVDFYPLIPHGAFFILGTLLGRKKIPDILFTYPKNKIGEALTLAGKNSLKVYLLHQPLFFLFYYLIKMI